MQDRSAPASPGIATPDIAPGPELNAAGIGPERGPVRPRGLLHVITTRQLMIVAGGLVMVIALNTIAQVRLNRWHGDFYGAIEDRNLDGFVVQLGVFLALAAALLILVVLQTWLQEVAKVRLRERLTNDLLDRWLAPRTAFKLNLMGGVGINPDQRVQEDVRNLSELSVRLGAGFVQSALLLLTFTGVLWTLSTSVTFNLFGEPVVIEGFMLWGTLLYSVAGSCLTYVVGRPLVRLNRERYSREAQFRFALTRVSESAEEIAFHRGERAERRSLDSVFLSVTTIMLSLARALANVTWVTSGYGWLGLVAPVVVAAPAYFSGAITFGGLMMAVQAFFQVQQSLRWFVDNFPIIAEWRATLVRVTEFREATEEPHIAVKDCEIRREPHPEGKLAFRGLRISLPEGYAEFDEPLVTIEPGEHVVVVGYAGAGKSTFVRAIAGLWTSGDGTIALPPQDEIAFLTQRPYLPLGSLHAALAYPEEEERWSREEIQDALQKVDLGHVAGALDEVKRWDRELSIDAQQRLAFARLVLHRPRWIILDEAASACTEDHRLAMHSLLASELPDAAVVAVSRDERTDGVFHRVLRLKRRTPAEMTVSAADRGTGDRSAPA